MSADVIPIYRKEIQKLLKSLEQIGRPAPKNVNAVFIDSKGFMKPARLTYPPPPVYRFAIQSPMVMSHDEDSSKFDMSKKIEFRFCQIVNDTFEYREIAP